MGEISLQEAVQRQRERIMELDGVVGVAGGLSPADPGKRCILVYATVSDWPKGLPHQLDGYDVELVRTSGFRAF